jgi:glutamate racemase
MAMGVGILFIIAVGMRCTQQYDPASKEKEMPIVHAMLREPDSFYYIDAKHYPRDNPNLPIGVLDSGTGGLTVLDAIVQLDRHNNADHTDALAGDGIRDFAAENFIFLGDTANMPYGAYPEADKTDLLIEHIFKDVQFLLGRKYYQRATDTRCQTNKSPVKVIVIACNTATAYGKSQIEAFLEKAGLDTKVIGVIDAGCRAAMDALGGEPGSIGVLATEGTVASGGYPAALVAEQTTRDGSPKRSLMLADQAPVRVFQQAGVGLAGAIDGAAEFIAPSATKLRTGYKGPAIGHGPASIDERLLPCYGFDESDNHLLCEGPRNAPTAIQLNSVKNYIDYHVVSLLEQVRKAAGAPKLKAIILGCTHYPYFTDLFAAKLRELYDYQESGRYMYRSCMAEKILFVDPAANTAMELYEYLRRQCLFNEGDLYNSEFYISVPNVLNPQVRLDEEGRFTWDYKYGRQAGWIQEYVKVVPFSRTTLEANTAARLAEKIPAVFDMIRRFYSQNPKTAFLSEAEKIK